MCIPCIVDRGVCRYLSIIDFISFRCTSNVYYNDKEAFDIYSKKMPMNVVGLTSREKVGLHYLLGWALHFGESVGSFCWFQKIINWLVFRSSIKIIYKFLFQFSSDFFLVMDLRQVSISQRLTWLRLSHRNSRVFKRLSFDNEENERPRKMVRREHSMYRDILTCC